MLPTRVIVLMKEPGKDLMRVFCFCYFDFHVSYFVVPANFGIRYGNDSYEQIQQRRQAAIVLDSPELLVMHAQARNDVSSSSPFPNHTSRTISLCLPPSQSPFISFPTSYPLVLSSARKPPGARRKVLTRHQSIPGTRHYFTKMLCGYLDENDKYEVFKTPPNEKESEKQKSKSKQQKGKGKDSSAS